MAEQLATLKDVMAFFGMGTAEFKTQWAALSEQDRTDLKVGIGNGSLTY